MPRPADPARRRFVLSTYGLGTAAITTGLAACAGETSSDRGLRFATLAAAEEELTRLAAAKELVSAAAWNWPQTLVHCAQSIEYSMTGFPSPRSELFQETIGSLAFGAFAWRGRMTHDLAEPIPGAPALERPGDAAQSVERLRASMRAFSGWSKPMRAHFAYGRLTHEQYELAHAMHLANHLSSFRAKA